MKKNVPLLGFVIGALLPVVGFLIVYALLGRGQSMRQFTAPHNLSKVLILSILINLAPFIYFNNKRYDLAARGVFIATMLYAVIDLLLKLTIG